MCAWVLWKMGIIARKCQRSDSSTSPSMRTTARYYVDTRCQQTGGHVVMPLTGDKSWQYGECYMGRDDNNSISRSELVTPAWWTKIYQNRCITSKQAPAPPFPFALEHLFEFCFTASAGSGPSFMILTSAVRSPLCYCRRRDRGHVES